MKQVQKGGDNCHMVQIGGDIEPPSVTRLPHKRWFNRRFPFRRVCLRRWCWSGQTYQHRCHKHQELP